MENITAAGIGFCAAIIVGIISAFVTLMLRKDPYKEFFYKQRFAAYSDILREVASLVDVCLSPKNHEEARDKKKSFALFMNSRTLWASKRIRHLLTELGNHLNAYTHPDADKFEEIVDKLIVINQQMHKELHTEIISRQIDGMFSSPLTKLG